MSEEMQTLFFHQVNECKSYLTGSLLPPDKGQVVSGSKLFLGGLFVYLRMSWVGKL